MSPLGYGELALAVIQGRQEPIGVVVILGGLVVVACGHFEGLLDAETVLVHVSHLPAGLRASLGFRHGVELESRREVLLDHVGTAEEGVSEDQWIEYAFGIALVELLDAVEDVGHAAFAQDV